MGIPESRLRSWFHTTWAGEETLTYYICRLSSSPTSLIAIYFETELK